MSPVLYALCRMRLSECVSALALAMSLCFSTPPLMRNSLRVARVHEARLQPHGVGPPSMLEAFPATGGSHASISTALKASNLRIEGSGVPPCPWQILSLT